VEAFAQGLGIVTEDFKRLTVMSGVRHDRKKLFAEKGYAAQMRQFVECVRKGRSPDVTVRDGVRATVACLRMLQSARTLQPLAINLDDICT
jgi:predicted dehydrogenase